MQTKQVGTTVFRKFDSIAEIAATPTNKASATRHRQVLNKNHESEEGVSWFGLANKTLTLEAIASNGWQSGASKLEGVLSDIAGSMELPAVRKRKQKTQGDTGDTLDFDRWRTGETDKAWTSIRKSGNQLGGNIIRLYVNIGANADINASDLFWSGATGVLVTNALENAGYRVEIIGFVSVANLFYSHAKNARNAFVAVPIKRAEEQLNIEFMASTIALPGFFRTYLFHALVTFTDLGTEINDGLGRSKPINDSDVKAFDEFGEGDILLPVGIHNKEQCILELRKITDKLK